MERPRASLEPTPAEQALLQRAEAGCTESHLPSATRVSQVDASRLETEFSSILQEELTAALRSAPPQCRSTLSVRVKCLRSA